MDDDAIRELVVRLSRPDAHGGHTIERATILAEGAHGSAIVTWILGHGGTAEMAVVAPSAGGLHGSLRGSAATPSSTPLRYVLPAGALA
ncbi:MAG: hypothetical protein Q8O56_18005 [Solirubrobacteraceae bacterium]|nr:hypothetical protein [Solirubrobacteraceae bacterium]